MSKTIMITGATGNLGSAAVKTFQQAGYKVIITVSPGKTVTLPDVIAYEVDLQNEKNVNQVMENVFHDHPTIDGLICIAGGFALGNISETGENLLNQMMVTNFNTAYFISRSVLSKMKSQAKGGHIIFIGSKPGMEPSSGSFAVAYTLSKSLLVNLSEIISEEGKENHVYSHVISPGTLDTPVNRKEMPEADFSQWVKPETLAEVMVMIMEKNSTTSVFKAYDQKMVNQLLLK